MQSKKLSLVEAIINTSVGFIISFLLVHFVLPYYGLHQDVKNEIEIVLIFTLVSIIRGYLIRRFFNFVQMSL